jgi:hypothetical protein
MPRIANFLAQIKHDRETIQAQLEDIEAGRTELRTRQGVNTTAETVVNLRTALRELDAILARHTDS